jgi:hypothetical protein
MFLLLYYVLLYKLLSTNSIFDFMLNAVFFFEIKFLNFLTLLFNSFFDTYSSLSDL